MKHRLATAAIVALISNVLAPGARAEAQDLFGSEDLDNNTLLVDTANAGIAVVGPSIEDYSFTGLAYDSSTGTLYVSDITDPVVPMTWGLGSVDLATGEVTYIGSQVNSLDIHGLAYDSTNDVLYGSSTFPDGLFVFNRATGEATLVGALGASGSGIRGLAYDAGSDVLYGIDGQNLYTIDRVTGAATPVGPHGAATDTFAMGLEFDPGTGRLYASFSRGLASAGGGASNAAALAGEVPAGGPAQTSDLYWIDPATGIATLIGDTGVPRLSGLAFATAGAPVSALAVPSLGSLGIAVLALALAAAGFVGLRRRSA